MQGRKGGYPSLVLRGESGDNSHLGGSNVGGLDILGSVEDRLSQGSLRA